MSQNDLGCSWSRNSDYASPEGRTKQMNGVTEDKGSEAANQLDHLFGYTASSYTKFRFRFTKFRLLDV